MDSLIRRIERLEAAMASQRFYTLEVFEGETDEQAFAAAGIAPAQRDTVILLTRVTQHGGGRFCSVVQRVA